MMAFSCACLSYSDLLQMAHVKASACGHAILWVMMPGLLVQAWQTIMDARMTAEATLPGPWSCSSKAARLRGGTL